MSNGNISSKLKNVHWTVYLGLIILIGIIRLCVIFSGRDGHHVDETWSYGFANSYYDPYDYTDNRYGITFGPEGIKNYREWIPGTIFKDYITVAGDERFTFDSVIYNKYEDLGPALYELVLHFVCSFFPESFSWWYAFGLNILFFIPTLIFVFFIAYEFTGSRACGFLSAVYYMLSGCGTAAFLYLRVYSLFTFLAVALFYLIVRILKYKSDKFRPVFLLLPVVTVLGCLTHYYFLVVAFLFTFFGAIMLLFKKRWLDSFRLCYIMLYSVMAFFAMYFQSVHMLIPHSTGEATIAGYSFPYSWELATANMHFFMGTLGFYIRFTVLYLIIAAGILFFAAAFIGLIVFLFRNESWMKSLIIKVRSFMERSYKTVVSFSKTIDPSALIAIPVSVAYLLILPKSASLVTMGFIERYFFPGMTVFLIFYISIVIKAVLSLGCKGKKHYVITTLLVLIIMFLNLRSNSLTDGFKFYNAGEKELAEELKGRDVFIVVDNLARDMTWISSVVSEADTVYIDLTGDINQGEYVFPELPEDCLVLLNSRGFLQEDENGNAITEYEITDNVNRPHLMKTTREFAAEIGEKNGRSYYLYDEYKCFIGDLRLYKCNAE